MRACVAATSSSRRSCAAAPRARVSAQVSTRVVGLPRSSTPRTLCQKVDTATAAISLARRPARASVSSTALAAARTRSSPSSEASPSLEVRTCRSRCAIALATGRPATSKRNERSPDVPISIERTSGACASRSRTASGSRTSAGVFLMGGEYRAG